MASRAVVTCIFDGSESNEAIILAQNDKALLTARSVLFIDGITGQMISTRQGLAPGGTENDKPTWFLDSIPAFDLFKTSEVRCGLEMSQRRALERIRQCENNRISFRDDETRPLHRRVHRL